MACGKLPYGENIEDPFSVYQAILTRETKFTANVGLPMRDIISKLLNKNPNKRLKNGST
jgi:serine/threonine protein kinase